MRKLFTVKFPLVKQYDQKDCGPAALLSIVKYYGGNSSLPYLRELCNTNLRGSSMLDVVNAAKIIGFKAIGASGEYEDLLKEKMPCIVHLIIDDKLNHFSVVYKIKDDKIRALYGHSLEKRIKKEPGEPPEFLFHGTSEKAYEKIKEIGLRPMSRQYVHLSIDTDMAQKVGKRKNKNPVILKVLAGKAYKDKINFYKGNEHVWLSDYVPPKYICRK